MISQRGIGHTNNAQFVNYNAKNKLLAPIISS